MHTDTDKQFTIDYTFKATRQQVWNAWTDPSIAAQWWHPHEVTVKDGSLHIDLREGGTYTYTMVVPGGGEYPTVGRYTKIVEPELLQFTWGAEEGSAQAEEHEGENPPLITVTLSDGADGTCDMRFHVQGAADDRGSEHGMHDGWVEAFEELDGVFAA